MTTGEIKQQSLRLWRFLEILGTIGALVLSLLLATGWRFQRPDEVITANENGIKDLARRAAVLETNYSTLSEQVRGVVRMQCLLISRHDANIAGTCEGLPTSDELSRRGR